MQGMQYCHIIKFIRLKVLVFRVYKLLQSMLYRQGMHYCYIIKFICLRALVCKVYCIGKVCNTVRLSNLFVGMQGMQGILEMQGMQYCHIIKLYRVSQKKLCFVLF